MQSEQQSSGDLIATKSSSKVTIAEVDAEHIINLLEQALLHYRATTLPSRARRLHRIWLRLNRVALDTYETKAMADKLQRYLDNRPN